MRARLARSDIPDILKPRRFPAFYCAAHLSDVISLVCALASIKILVADQHQSARLAVRDT